MEFAIALLAVVLLYLGTKDRWRWKLILLRGFVIALIASAIGGAISGFFEWKRSKDSEPRPIGALRGVQLGASPADVRFQKGEPKTVEGAEWYFESDGEGLMVNFQSDRVSSILLVPGDYHYSSEVQNIQKGTFVSVVLDKLGQPDSIIENADGLMRTFCYPRLNTFLVCEEGKVSAVGIFDPSTGKPAFFAKGK